MFEKILKSLYIEACIQKLNPYNLKIVDIKYKTHAKYTTSLCDIRILNIQ
jgi:hypothetical protein